MTNGADINQLKEHIQRDNSLEAERFVRLHPVESEPVLESFSQSNNTDIRRIVVELAGIHASPGNCRLLLGRLADNEMEIRELAKAQLGYCNISGLLPDLVEALQQYDDPDTLSVLVLLIGQIGGKSEIEPLTQLRDSHQQDDGLEHDISLALAKLGNANAIEQLRQRLESNIDQTDRVSALNDCLYVGDPSLVAYFGPALRDHRDTVALSIPENPPMEYARVVDIAVFTMAQLGVRLPYRLDELTRLSEEQIQQASLIVLGTH